MPMNTTLSVATLNQYAILVYKVFYSSVEAALTLNVNRMMMNLICMQPKIVLGSDLQLQIENGNVEAFVRSGMCIQCMNHTIPTLEYSCSKYVSRFLLTNT